MEVLQGPGRDEIFPYRQNFGPFRAEMILPKRTHHACIPFGLIIAFRKTAAIIEIHQLLDISLIHLIVFLSFFFQKIQIFPVNSGHAGRVLRPLHPSLDLQGIDSGLQNLRQDLQSADILGA